VHPRRHGQIAGHKDTNNICKFIAEKEKSGKKFGRQAKKNYLCSVRTLVLTTPLSAGNKT